MDESVSLVVATFGDEVWRRAGVVTALAHGDPEADEVIVRHDSSLARARNLAAVEAGSAWLCFLDADDTLEVGYLAAMRRAMAALEGRPALLAPALEIASGGPVRPGEIPNQPRRPLIEINSCVIGTLVPRDLFLDVGGFPDVPAAEDWGCWLRCEHAGAEVVYVPEAVYLANSSPRGRQATNGGARLAARRRVLADFTHWKASR